MAVTTGILLFHAVIASTCLYGAFTLRDFIPRLFSLFCGMFFVIFGYILGVQVAIDNSIGTPTENLLSYGIWAIGFLFLGVLAYTCYWFFQDRIKQGMEVFK